jgi:hypothetical protein
VAPLRAGHRAPSPARRRSAGGVCNRTNVSLSFGVLRIAYWLGWWDYQPGPIAEAWPRIWLTIAQVAPPLAAGALTYRYDQRLHLSAVMLAALLFSPLCWDLYLTVALVPLAAWMGISARDPVTAERLKRS